MAKWFRSEDMSYVSIIVNEDAAHACISDLGKLGVIQFTDLNPELTAFQRRYVAYIKRIDEVERKLSFLGDEVKKFDLKVASAGTVEAFTQNSSARAAAAFGPNAGRTEVQSGQALLQTLENELEGLETHLVELNRYSERLTTEYNEKVEFQEVLIKTRGLFASEMPRIRVEEQASGARSYHDDGASVESGSIQMANSPQHLLHPTAQQRAAHDADMRFSYMAGVLEASDRTRFERQLFRTTRGNCYAQFAEIEQPISDPQTGALVHKLVFIVFYKSSAIEAKIKKICEAFKASRYPLPDMDDSSAVGRLMNENYSDMHDARVVLLKNRDLRLSLCVKAAERLEGWTWTVLREKSVYHTLNTFKPDVRGILRGEGWVVTESLGWVQQAVNKAHADMDMGMPSMVEVMPKPWPTPPTYFKLNPFTIAFQEFVDTYGVPRYKEANPALFTAATFPFLYGIMYGDIGHGSIIFMFGMFLVMSAHKVAGRRDLGELMSGMYLGRYMIAMMGFFSVYAGLIYNDFFSIPLNLFGSSWVWEEGEDGSPPEAGTEATNQGDYGDADSVYPFGIDPAWHVADNELLFFNSMKMKMSVILGVTQMVFGIILKAMNALYFKESLDFFFEFIPMMVFSLSLFGYMVVLIFLKWSINWEERMYSATCLDSGFTPGGLACDSSSTTNEMCPLDFGGSGDGCQPPNLITTLINIALSPGGCDEPMFKGQAEMQVVLLLLAFGSIPVLLLGKPLMIRSRMKREERQDSFSSESQLIGDTHGGAGVSGVDKDGGHGGHEDGHDFSEIVIHQVIETIEFVLGMVSNTASYLRLWALSLAHTELASVFWEKAMLATINMGNAFAIFVGFAIFAAVTFGVLLCMDVMECFLHALRLHWVEFQNKFYKADGYKFSPYSIEAIITASPVL